MILVLCVFHHYFSLSKLSTSFDFALSRQLMKAPWRRIWGWLVPQPRTQRLNSSGRFVKLNYWLVKKASLLLPCPASSCLNDQFSFYIFRDFNASLSLISEENLLCVFLPLLVKVCSSPGRYSHPQLATAACLALSQYMMIRYKSPHCPSLSFGTNKLSNELFSRHSTTTSFAMK